jgi:hypothetical protein
MYNKRTSSLGLLSTVVLMILLAVSCSREDLTQDLNIYVGNDFLVSPITVQISDAYDAQKIPADATITVEGKDKDKIYSLLGEKSITLYSGVATLAIKKTDLPTQSNPLEFSLVIQAKDYLTKHVNYKLTEVEPQVNYVNIIDLKSPPKGLSISENAFTSTISKGVNEAVVLKSPLSNGKTASADITINPNTKMMTKEGKVIEGNIKTLFIHSDAKSLDAVEAMEDWGQELQVQNRSGQIINTYINPMSFFELSMTNGTDKVEKFSQPIKAVTYLDANTFNPAKNRNIAEGDELLVNSLSEGEEIWKEEGVVKVQKANDGRFMVSFDLNHLSTYTLHPLDMYCIRSIQINSNLFTSTGENCTNNLKRYFYCIVDANNPKIIYTGGSSTFENGSKLRGTAYMVSNSVKIHVFENRNSTTPIYVSDVIRPCLRDDIRIPSGSLPQDRTAQVKVNVSALCTGNINATFLPSVPVLYREMGRPNAPWELLGDIKPNGNTSTGCTNKLEEGKFYDFAIGVKMVGSQVVQGNEQLLTFTKCLKRPNGLQIVDQEFDARSDFWGYTSQNGFQEKFQIKKTPGTNIYDLNYPNCPLPEKACSELQNKYSAFVRKK